MAVINVPADRPTLAAAALVAVGGDIVLVADGIYNESNILWGGAGPNFIYVVAVNVGMVTWRSAGAFHCTRTGGTGVRFSGIIFDGYDAAHYAIVANDSDSRADDCMFSGAGRGFRAQPGTADHFCRRCITTSGTYGIDLSSSLRGGIINCLDTGSGTAFSAGTDTAIKHCTSDSARTRGFELLHPCTVRNCVATNGGGDGFHLGDAGADVDYCDSWNNATNYDELDALKGVNCIEVNPHYIGGGDFHVVWGSCCIEGGVDVAVTDDLDGNPRPCGPLPDLGCYEYQDVTAPTISHLPVATSKAGTAIPVVAEVTDDLSGVAWVRVYYRATGTVPWLFVAAPLVSGNTYRGVIPAAVVTTAGVDYYIASDDNWGNHATHPPGAP